MVSDIMQDIFVPVPDPGTAPIPVPCLNTGILLLLLRFYEN
jgi:hypothetical protein